ncbi:MAG: hypothetical protein ACREQ3_08010 [Candidatus Binatia bacterium]
MALLFALSQAPAWALTINVTGGCPLVDAIADLIGSVDGLPADLSTRKKQYLETVAKLFRV